MPISVEVQLQSIQLQSGTICALRFSQAPEAAQGGRPVSVAEMINVNVADTIGLVVGGIYKLTIS